MVLENLHGPDVRRCLRRQQLAGDASTRRYTRIWDACDRSFILVEYPDEVRRQMRRDLEVAGWLRDLGIRVPAVISRDLQSGWLVLEDLGAEDAEAVLRRAPEPDRLGVAQRGLQPLKVLSDQRISSLVAWNQPLDRERMRWELAGFEMWFVRYHRRAAPSADLDRWLDTLAAEIAHHPQRICHRDYHLNNLFLTPDGDTAVIDAQDVLVGPDTYDAVSLIEERAMPELLGKADLGRLRTAWAEQTRAVDGWRARWQLVRVQRSLKVLGTFARLVVSGRPTYGSWMARLAARLAADSGELGLPTELVDLLLD